MATRVSKEKIEQIRKFCQTHPKRDAEKRFGLTAATIHRHTKGINWKKKNNKNDS
jgi:hypothetical protein